MAAGKILKKRKKCQIWKGVLEFSDLFTKVHSFYLSSLRALLKESFPGVELDGLAACIWRIYDTDLDGKADVVGSHSTIAVGDKTGQYELSMEAPTAPS